MFCSVLFYIKIIIFKIEVLNQKLLIEKNYTAIFKIKYSKFYAIFGLLKVNCLINLPLNIFIRSWKYV